MGGVVSARGQKREASVTILLGGAVLAAAALVSVLFLHAGTAHANSGAGDTDHDWCANQQELGSDPLAGGGPRNPKWQWDYWDPNHDRQFRIGDIVDVVSQYYQDKYLPPPAPPNTANPFYNEQMDRTALGPNPWNLGPPDRQERINDILIAVAQYYNDCPRTVSHSWYITNYHVTPEVSCIPPGSSNCGPFTMLSIGHDDGGADSVNCADSLVVLDFGQPDYSNGTYGTNYYTDYSPHYKFISDADIEAAAEYYAYGWWHNTPTCPQLKLVIGTNNTHLGVVAEDGGNLATAASNWALVVEHVQQYLHNHGYDGQITAWGGSDMEQPDGTVPDWSCYNLTKVFIDNYNQPGAPTFVDYGAANLPNSGCIDDGSTPILAEGHGVWNELAVYYVAWSGGAPERPFPEIYNASNSTQWRDVKLVGDYIYQGVPMYIEGVMTTTRFLSPVEAEQNLWNTLRASGLEQDYFPRSSFLACLGC